MFEKRAEYKLIDAERLNVPAFIMNAVNDPESFIKNQEQLIPVPGALSQTIEKIAAAEKNSSEEKSGDGEDSPAFDLQAEIEKHPDSLFIKCFAIKADETNDNGDYFSRDELVKATPTFVGVPLFTNHANADINEARGKVVHSWWDDEQNGIMIVGRVDAEAYPQLARGIKEEYVVGTSMGASRGHDLVTMADGNKKRVDEIQIDDEVITHSGAIEKIGAVCQTQEHSKLYHVKWSSNLSGLALSYEHPIFVLKRDDVYRLSSGGKKYRHTIDHIKNEVNPEFIPVSELKYEDYVLEWIDKSVIKDAGISEEYAFLLGMYAAEGYFRDDFVEFCFGANDPHIEKTISALENNFSGKISRIDRVDDRNGYYVRIFDRNLIALCKQYIGTGSRNKTLDHKILHWPLSLQKIFISAYIDGDGCVVKERTDKNGRSTGTGAIQISSASLDLLRGVRQICLRLGCPATLSSHERIAKKSTVMSQNTEYVEHILYINNGITEKLQKYSNKASSAPKAKQQRYESFFYKDYIAHKIKEVVIIDNSEPTYYIQVGKFDDENSDRSYILNDIVNHNCQVQYSICSVCHNYAETPDQYCSCIRERKTRMVQSRKQECKYHERGDESECPVCGSTKAEPKKYAVSTKVFEYNYGIKFIENSFVVNPACSNCGVTEIIDPKAFRTKVAAIEKVLPRLLKAAGEHPLTCTDQSCIKIGGQQELDSLNKALDMLSSVSQSMLNQKEQIDLEFLSDLVTVLAELQTVTDELTEQGYGRLQSPGQPPSSGENPEQIQQGAPEVTNRAEPLKPTPGGGSKVHSGPAGQVGNVTSPFANKKRLNLEKLSQKIISKNKRLNIPNLSIAQKEKSTPDYSELPEENKALKVAFSLPQSASLI